MQSLRTDRDKDPDRNQDANQNMSIDQNEDTDQKMDTNQAAGNTSDLNMDTKSGMPERTKRFQKWQDAFREKVHHRTGHMKIQTMIAITFTMLTIIGMSFLGIVLYRVFNNQMIASVEKTSVQLLDQTSISLRDYLRSMMQITETMNYSVLKQKDLAKDDITDQMALLYAENQEYLISIACFDSQGRLIAAEPTSTLKENADVIKQDWFAEADDVNPVFSTPHIQNLFDSTSYEYYRVISLSQRVELTENGSISEGVLDIDMSYQGIEEIFQSLNDENSEGYTYLVDGKGNGTIIYHPDINQIDAGLYEEVSLSMEKNRDGCSRETINGADYIVAVKTVSYTGWKIIRVVPVSEISVGLQSTRYFAVLLVVITMMILTILTRILSRQLTSPLDQLTRSIENLQGDDFSGEIDAEGSYEVEYLGNTVKQLLGRIRKLKKDIVNEQEEKRKSELDALQAQINPHFLYNTLDSIIWMIEAERNRDAIFMIRQLASLFRISLSKGRTIIPISDELKHAENYMNIQKIRYRNKFEMTYDIDPEILNGSTVKLVIQPILENSLYYAVEALDGDGEITLKGYRKGEDVYIQIIDNGLGMSEETLSKLLVEGAYVPKRGSGVGLINVHKRIQIRFGTQYGLQISSIPDEGTRVTIHLPYQKYEGGTRDAK